jgi:hypothetical protein
MPPFLTGPYFANAELLNQRAITSDVFRPQISLEPSPLTDENHQASAGVEVLLIASKVLGDLLNTRLHDGDLDLGRAGVPLRLGVVNDDLVLERLI